MASKILKKLFVSGHWVIAIKKDEEAEFKVVFDDKYNWAADPFIFSYNDKLYVFAEKYNFAKQRGYIAVAGLTDKLIFTPIIKNKYHMSYPCVFDYSGSIYMIPESGENKTVDIYKCINFPYEWKKIKTLLSGEDYADTTVFIDGKGNYKFLTFFKKGKIFINRIYDLDMNAIEIKINSEIMSNHNNIRPAGNYFYRNGILYRPAQNCETCYGKEIIVNTVNLENFAEEKVEIISNENIKIENLKFDRVHTLNYANGYTIIDAFVNKIDILKPIYMTFRIVRRKIKKRKR